MQLKLIRIRRLPKTKNCFALQLQVGATLLRTRATVHPKFGHSIEFTDDETLTLLLKAGRKIRHLCTAILTAHPGQKLRLPLSFPDHESTLSNNLRLTVPTPKDATRMAGVG